MSITSCRAKGSLFAVAVLTLSVACTAASAAEPYRLVLVPRAGDTQLTHRNFDWPAEHTVSVTKTSLHGGRQEGVELITIDNGAMQITVIPTRGMNILEVRHGDVRLGWNSPVKEVVHPQFINLESRGGLGWLEGFNEWLVRCGLEFAGHPGLDQFVTNTGDTAEMELTLHGKIGNIPATEVTLIVDREPPYRMSLRGVVHERMFYGPKLELTTELTTTPGSDTFTVHDAITNHGASSQEFQLIYHANFGRPLLEGGSRWHAAIKSIAPMNDHAAEGIDRYGEYAPPTNGFIEEVYLINPYSDAEGRSAAMIQNASGNAAASVQWSTDELPYLTIWKNTAAEADGYVTGVEPATGFPYNRRVERAVGRLPVLAAGETRDFTVEFGIHVGAESVDALRDRIDQIRGDRSIDVQTSPPEVPEFE